MFIWASNPLQFNIACDSLPTGISHRVSLEFSFNLLSFPDWWSCALNYLSPFTPGVYTAMHVMRFCWRPRTEWDFEGSPHALKAFVSGSTAWKRQWLLWKPRSEVTFLHLAQPSVPSDLASKSSEGALLGPPPTANPPRWGVILGLTLWAGLGRYLTFNLSLGCC